MALDAMPMAIQMPSSQMVPAPLQELAEILGTPGTATTNAPLDPVVDFVNNLVPEDTHGVVSNIMNEPDDRGDTITGTVATNASPFQGVVDTVKSSYQSIMKTLFRRGSDAGAAAPVPTSLVPPTPYKFTIHNSMVPAAHPDDVEMAAMQAPTHPQDSAVATTDSGADDDQPGHGRELVDVVALGPKEPKAPSGQTTFSDIFENVRNQVDDLLEEHVDDPDVIMVLEKIKQKADSFSKRYKNDAKRENKLQFWLRNMGNWYAARVKGFGKQLTPIDFGTDSTQALTKNHDPSNHAVRKSRKKVSDRELLADDLNDEPNLDIQIKKAKALADTMLKQILGEFPLNRTNDRIMERCNSVRTPLQILEMVKNYQDVVIETTITKLRELAIENDLLLRWTDGLKPGCAEPDRRGGSCNGQKSLVRLYDNTRARLDEIQMHIDYHVKFSGMAFHQTVDYVDYVHRALRVLYNEYTEAARRQYSFFDIRPKELPFTAYNEISNYEKLGTIITEKTDAYVDGLPSTAAATPYPTRRSLDQYHVDLAIMQRMLDRVNVVIEREEPNARRMKSLFPRYEILQRHLDEELVNWSCDVQFEQGDISLGCRDDPDAKSEHFYSQLSYVGRVFDKAEWAAGIDNNFLDVLRDDGPRISVDADLLEIWNEIEPRVPDF